MDASDNPPARLPANGFRVDVGVTAEVAVSLWGDLGLGWFGRLSTALARRGLSIRDARALRIEQAFWTGRLELATADARVDPYTLDYLELAGEPDAGVRAEREPRLSRARIERSTGGTLELRFLASDQLGLLASLLERCEFLGLFPEQLTATTAGGVVEDTLWLRAVAGHPPSPQAEAALRELITRLSS